MKKAILTLLMIPAFVGMLFSCSEVKTDAKKLEGKWNIVEVKGEKILKEGLPNMEFDMKIIKFTVMPDVISLIRLSCWTTRIFLPSRSTPQPLP